MKKRNLLFTSLAVFGLGVGSVFALEAEEGWTKVFASREEIAVDKIELLKEQLADKVEELNLSSIDKGLNELYRYRIEKNTDEEEDTYQEISNEKKFATGEEAVDWAKNNEPEENGWSFIQNIVKALEPITRIFEKTKYEYEAEAIVAKDTFDKSIDEGTGEAVITPVYDESENREEAVSDNHKFYDRDEALRAAEQLYEDNHEFKVVATVVDGTDEYENTTTEDIIIEEYFATRELAQAYIDSLIAEGYQVVAPIIQPITHIEKVAELHRNDYNSLEEAEAAYDTFVEENKDASEGVTGNGAYAILNPEKNQVGEWVSGTQEYASEEAANVVKISLPSNVEGNVRKSSKTTDTIILGDAEGQVKKVFNTELEAIQYIEGLKAQGYDVSGLTRELVSYEESIWEEEDGTIVDPGQSDNITFKYTHFDVAILESFKEELSDGTTRTVTGTMTLSEVKVTNNGVTTKIEMKDKPDYDNLHESGTPKKEYRSKDRRNLNINNKSYIEISGHVVTDDGRRIPFTVEGYLSESQNICRNEDKGYDLVFKSVTIVKNKALVDTNIVHQYKVNGTAIKSEDVWYLDTRTTTLGYDYCVDAEAYHEVLDGFNIIGTKSMDHYKDVYVLNVVKTIKGYDYEVEGIGMKTYYDVVSKYVRLTDVEWIIESMSFGKGGDVEVLPPQTGVETVNNVFNFITLIGVGLVLIIKKFI